MPRMPPTELVTMMTAALALVDQVGTVALSVCHVPTTLTSIIVRNCSSVSSHKSP